MKLEKFPLKTSKFIITKERKIQPIAGKLLLTVSSMA